jgi:chloramphenicol O-acetyltransferase type A
MKTLLDIETWSRKDHFHFFRKFDEPFFGATVNIDCTQAYDAVKTNDSSFFLYYLHKTLAAVNAVEPFRYRISGEAIHIYDRVDASPTISREDGSFAFSLVQFDPDLATFNKMAKEEIERVRITPGLFTRQFDEANIIHFSALPWIDFTSLSHARSFSLPDSCPKISFGKMTVSETGKKTMPMSVHVHHGLMDGFHVGQFIDRLQLEMNRD